MNIGTNPDFATVVLWRFANNLIAFAGYTILTSSLVFLNQFTTKSHIQRLAEHQKIALSLYIAMVQLLGGVGFA